MKRIPIALCLAACLFAACGAAPINGPEAGATPEKITGRKMAGEIEVVTHALFAYYGEPDPSPGTNCDGATSNTNPGSNTVKLFQEWTPDSASGWCRAFTKTGTGSWSLNFPPPHNDNLSSLCVGQNLRLEVFQHIHGGSDIGVFVAEGTDDYGHACVDLAVGWPWPSYWWHDSASSFRVCQRSEKASMGGWCPP